MEPTKTIRRKGFIERHRAWLMGFGIGLPGSDVILRLFRWEKRLLARFVVTSFGRAGMSMAVMLLIKEFLAGALGGEHSAVADTVTGLFGHGALLWVLAAALLGAYVGGSLFSYDNQVVQQRIVKVLELGLMERLIRHLLKLSVPFFDRTTHGDVVQAVRQDISQLRIVVISVANVFLEGLTALFLVAAAIQLSPWLTLWGLIVLPLALLPIFMIAKKTLAQSYTIRKTGYVLFDVILQILNGIRVIKAYRMEEKKAEITIEKGRLYFDEMIEMVRVRSFATVVLESMAGLGVVVVIVIGGLSIMSGSLSWPALMAFVMTMRQIHGPLNNMNYHFVQVQTNGASVERITELLAVEPEIRDAPDALPLPAAPRRITFEDVSFAYTKGSERKTVLEGIGFDVPAGMTVGIVGPSGAGKSTLLNLLVRFYDPSTGRVLFDGRDLRTFKVGDVYDKIAIVMQRPFLFAASIRDNIRCGRPAASDAEVEEAARAAFVHDEIVDLPEGYDTLVGIGGSGLSGGQEQRINVARALLKNAPILLLDEATSALDSVSEAEVQKAIERLMRGRTSFVIAHRLSTLRNADKILVLDKGRVVGFGTHAELVGTCPVYRRVWETQMLDRARPAAAA